MVDSILTSVVLEGWAHANVEGSHPEDWGYNLWMMTIREGETNPPIAIEETLSSGSGGQWSGAEPTFSFSDAATAENRMQASKEKRLGSSSLVSLKTRESTDWRHANQAEVQISKSQLVQLLTPSDDLTLQSFCTRCRSCRRRLAQLC